MINKDLTCNYHKDKYKILSNYISDYDNTDFVKIYELYKSSYPKDPINTNKYNEHFYFLLLTYAKSETNIDQSDGYYNKLNTLNIDEIIDMIKKLFNIYCNVNDLQIEIKLKNMLNVKFDNDSYIHIILLDLYRRICYDINNTLGYKEKNTYYNWNLAKKILYLLNSPVPYEFMRNHISSINFIYCLLKNYIKGFKYTFEYFLNKCQPYNLDILKLSIYLNNNS